MSAATLPRIDADRLALIETLNIDRGCHQNFETGHCTMEVVAWLLGLEHTDAPSCIDPDLADFVRELNDALDTIERQRLRSYAVRLATYGGHSDAADLITAANASLDRRWLRLSGYSANQVTGVLSLRLLDGLTLTANRADDDSRPQHLARLFVAQAANQESYPHYDYVKRALSSPNITFVGGVTKSEANNLIAEHPAFEGYRRTRAEAVDAAFDLLDGLIADHEPTPTRKA